MNETGLYWIGLDVADRTFDAAVARSGERASATAFKGLPAQTFERTPEGVEAFVTSLQTQVPGPAPLPARAVMEATGNYSIQLAAMLSNACPELRPAIVNPEWTCAFRNSLGLRNKTDRMDARALAFYGRERQPEPYEPLSPEQARLREMSRCRDGLIRSRTAHENQLAQKPSCPLVRSTLKAVIARLQKAIDRIEQAMRDLIQTRPSLRSDYELLTGIPGVGFVTAAVILAEVGDLRRFGKARQVTAFAGVTPRQNQSGNHTSPGRMSKKGNGRIRQALYLSALSAITYNPPLAATYRRLVADGKKPMVALGAVMRKLLVLMWAIVNSGKPFHAGGKPHEDFNLQVQKTP